MTVSTCFQLPPRLLPGEDLYAGQQLVVVPTTLLRRLLHEASTVDAATRQAIEIVLTQRQQDEQLLPPELLAELRTLHDGHIAGIEVDGRLHPWLVVRLRDGRVLEGAAARVFEQVIIGRCMLSPRTPMLLRDAQGLPPAAVRHRGLGGGRPGASVASVTSPVPVFVEQPPRTRYYPPAPFRRG